MADRPTAELHEAFLRELREWGGDIDIALANSGTALVPVGLPDRLKVRIDRYREERDRLARLLGLVLDAEDGRGIASGFVPVDDILHALLDISPRHAPPDEDELYDEWCDWITNV